MVAAFRDMQRARTSTGVRFWTFVVADTALAVARERLDGVRWTAAALFGLLVTITAAQATTFTYQYFYHPYFEGASIPALPYGLALGVVLSISVGVAQWFLFPAAERCASRWALASAVAIPIAILFCSSAIEQAMDGLKPVAATPHPLLLDLLVVSLGRPNTWMDLATQFSAMAASALVVRALLLNAAPVEKGRRHAH
jgi:hypothetical protein